MTGCQGEAGSVEMDISRLVARIAELEERLYAAELKNDTQHTADQPNNPSGAEEPAVEDQLPAHPTAHVFVSTVRNLWRKTTEVGKTILGEDLLEEDATRAAQQQQEFTDDEREALLKSKNTAAAYLAEASNKLQAAETEKEALNTKLQAIQQEAQRKMDEANKVAQDVRTEAEQQAKALNISLEAEVASLKEQVSSLQQFGSTLEQALSASQDATQAAQAHAGEMEKRWLEERMRRREIHEELQPEEAVAVTFPAEGVVNVQPQDGKRSMQEFEFDAAFAPGSTQEDVFKQVESLVRSSADGFNVCIFAYGQTGSGKTHTMEGPRVDPGISVRALQTLFEMIEEDSKHKKGLGDDLEAPTRQIDVSMMEIYNEAVRDLLREKDVASPLDVSAMGAGQMPPGVERVPGLTWRNVSSMEEVLEALKAGSQNRSTCATKMNSSSSRSHALLCVRLGSPQGRGSPSSYLHLVDLAGSERVNKSGVSGDALKEAQAINKSLSALGDVISSLQRKAGHIPFRNSKLTQVLQDSLSGSSKVMLVCNVSPDANSVSETLSSLQFASRAAQVELGQAKKVGETPPPGPKSSGDGGKKTPAAGSRKNSGRTPGSSSRPGSGSSKNLVTP